MKDYMDAPEASSIYININTTKVPMNDLRVRRAFDLAIDKDTWVTVAEDNEAAAGDYTDWNLSRLSTAARREIRS